MSQISFLPNGMNPNSWIFVWTIPLDGTAGHATAEVAAQSAEGSRQVLIDYLVKTPFDQTQVDYLSVEELPSPNGAVRGSRDHSFSVKRYTVCEEGKAPVELEIQKVWRAVTP